MEKLQPITIEKNEQYLRQSSKEVDISDPELHNNIVVLQEDEVQDIKWFTREEVIEKINNNFDTLTNKGGCWNYLMKYFETYIKEKNNEL